jgi:hypothetical protein
MQDAPGEDFCRPADQLAALVVVSYSKTYPVPSVSFDLYS